VKIQIDGRWLLLKFKHVRYPYEQTVVMDSAGNEAQAHTLAQVISPSDGMVLAEGRAFCSVSDNFDKKVGRELALTRALQGVKREQRKQVWEQYWQGVGFGEEKP